MFVDTVLLTWHLCSFKKKFFQKAYDCIPYDLLLAKLESDGVDKKNFKLFYTRSYLFGRKQRVKLNSEYSSFIDTDRGISQGFILGTPLFQFYYFFKRF